MYAIIYRTLMSIATLTNQPRDVISFDLPGKSVTNQTTCKLNGWQLL